MKSPIPHSILRIRTAIILGLLSITGLIGAQTEWVDSQRVGDQVRFLYSDRIIRYDLASKTWLAPVGLPRSGAVAMTADQNGAAVAYGAELYLYSTEFTSEQPLPSASSPIESIFVDRNLLIAVHSSGLYARITSFDRQTRVQISSTETYVDSLYGASHGPESNRLYGRTKGVGPSDIVTGSYTDDGVISRTDDSPYHGDYPGAFKTWIFPDEQRVVDSSGTVYAAPGLTYAGTLAGAVTDIAFNGDVPFAIRPGAVVAFGPSLLEAGQKSVTTGDNSKLFVTTEDAFIFTPTTGLPAVEIISLSDLNAPEPNTPIDPNGIPYSIDEAFIDRDGDVLLFSKAQLSLFRWSPTERSYTNTYPLVGIPDFAAYSKENHTAYFAYANQTVRAMDLSLADPVESSLFALPGTPSGLATAGEFVFASDPSGAWNSHYVFSPAGELIESKEWNRYSRVWEWDPNKRRMYFFRDGTSPNDLHFETIGDDGTITGEGETPYHGDFSATPPIRSNPDGTQVIIGSGVVFETEDMTQVANLANTFSDGVWSDGEFVTIREINGLTQLQTWQGNQFLPGPAVRQFNGSPVRILETTEGLLIITSIEGTPRFLLLDDNFDPVFISPTQPVAPGNLTVTETTTNSVSLEWDDLSDNEDTFRVDYRVLDNEGVPITEAWTEGSSSESGINQTAIEGLPSNTRFQIRVIAISGTLESESSPLVTTRTPSSVDEPVGEPYELNASRVFANSITIEWNDNANNETGFRVIRTDPGNTSPTVAIAPANATSFTANRLDRNTTYRFRIQAVNGAIGGALSDEISIRTLSRDSAPNLSFSVRVDEVTPTSVKLVWEDVSSNEVGFLIERSLFQSNDWVEVGRTAHNSESFTDSNALPDQRYTYRVSAYNDSGSSIFRSANATTLTLGGEFTGHAMRSGGIYYFSFSRPDRIERYDIAARSWLDTIPLEATASAMWVDESGIFVAEDRSVVRFSLEGGDRVAIANAQDTVTSLFTLKDILVFDNGGRGSVSMDKNSGILLANFSYSYRGAGYSSAPELDRVFFRSTGVSPSDIHYIELNTDGEFISGNDSPYHGTYPNASRTYLFPDGARVADNSGSVYSTESLTFTNSLGESFTDLDFHGSNIPILLRENRLQSYTNTLLEAGSFTLSDEGLRVAVSGDDAIVFFADGNDLRGLRVESIPLSQLATPEPGQPIDPNGLPYSIDQAFADRDGNLLLFSKAQLSLFNWSPSERRYTSTHPLVGVPDYAAYSKENHTAYFAYGSQIVRAMDLEETNPAEVSFAALSGSPLGLATAGEFISSYDTSTHFVFSPAGDILQTANRFRQSRVWEWDPVMRRMYHFRDGISPNDLLFEAIDTNGTIIGSGETPYHGDFSILPPVRVSPDGSQVLIGSGVIFDSEGLTRTANLANSITDATWVDGKLITIRKINDLTQLQTWEGDGFVPGTIVRQFSGSPVRIFDTPSGLVLITSVEDTPRFTILDENYDPVFISPTRPLAPSDLTVSGRTHDSVSLRWNDLSDNEDFFRVDYRSADGEWLTGATVAEGTNSATVSGLTPGIEWEFRAVAIAGTLESAFTPPVNARTLGSADEPAGEPYNLRVTRVFSSSLTVEWDDNSDKESGFWIFRSTTEGGRATRFSTGQNETSFTFDRLSSGSTYFFRVQAINRNTAGELSGSISARTLNSDSPPNPPTSLRVDGVTPTSVTLSWTDSSTNEEGFLIERSINSSDDWTRLGSVPYNTESFTDSTVKPDSRYTYRVSAFSNSGSSSRTVNADTPSLGGEFTGFAMRAGDIYYFAFTSPDRIERYEISSTSWLTAIPLNAEPTALWVDESGIFVAEDRSVLRFSLESGNRTPLGNAQSTVSGLFTTNDILAFNNSGRNFISMDKNTGVLLDNFNASYNGSGYSSAPGTNRVFFRSTGVSPSDINYIELGSDGKLISSDDSPYHGSYPSASRTFVFPDGARVADNSGTVYSTESLTYTNSLGTAFTDMDFHGPDIPIVLRDNSLFSYTNTLLEAGSFQLGGTGLRVAVSGENALVFFTDHTNTRGLRVESVGLESLAAPEPGQPISPGGIPYTIDDVFVDRDGDLLIFSKSQLSLFRWSPVERRYTDTHPLLGVPEFATYSKKNDTAYFAYSSQTVRAMDFAEPSPSESSLFTLPGRPNGLATAGEFVFASDPSGAWNTHYVFSPGGEMLQAVEWNRYSRVWEWDPVKRRMYFFRDGTSPNDLHFETIDREGNITDDGETPYHGSISIVPPIRVSPDGKNVVIGSGIVFETEGMSQVDTLPDSIVDAAWIDQQLFLIRLIDQTRTEITKRTPPLSTGQGSRIDVLGTPVRILALNQDTLALITMEAGVPRIYLLDPDLEIIHSFISTPDAVEDKAFSWTPAFDWSELGSEPISIDAIQLPDWLSFSNGRFAGTPREADSGDRVTHRMAHRVVLRAIGSGRTSLRREFEINALWRNDPPSLPGDPIQVAANDQGESVALDLGALLSDPDGRDIHRWSILETTNPSIFSEPAISADGILDLNFAPYVSGSSTMLISVKDAAEEEARISVDVSLPELPEPSVSVDDRIQLNRQTGLYEHAIKVTNTGAREIAGFDLAITGLPEGVTIQNSSNQATGGGLVYHRQPLGPGATVTLVLEYHAPVRGTVLDPDAEVTLVTEPELDPTAEHAGVAVDRCLLLPENGLLIEFTSVPGARYEIQYSDNATDWKVSPMPIRAAGNRVQWIDRGPPRTDSSPETKTSRYYRVRELDR